MSKASTPEQHFHLVLSGEEYGKMCGDAHRCGLSKSAYLRRLIMGKELRPSREKEINKLIAEVNKIGSNVNQVARAANSGQLSQVQADEMIFMLGQIYSLMGKMARL